MKFSIVVLAVIIAACSSETEEPKGVIPQAQLDAMEKAKQVEGVLKKQDERLRKSLEETDSL